MPRLLGVDIPGNKALPYSFTHIFGIGRKVALQVCEGLNLDTSRKAHTLTDEELARIAAFVEKNYVVEGNLRRQRTQNVNRLRDIKCYRGLRHRAGVPARLRYSGSRTRYVQAW